jgi:hypothetical protein
MKKSISQTEFKELKPGDILIGINGIQKPEFKIHFALCGKPNAYPTHLVETQSGEDEFIFHDGVSIRYSSDDKEHDGNTVGELNDKDHRAFGEIRAKKAISNSTTS